MRTVVAVMGVMRAELSRGLSVTLEGVFQGACRGEGRGGAAEAEYRPYRQCSCKAVRAMMDETFAQRTEGKATRRGSRFAIGQRSDTLGRLILSGSNAFIVAQAVQSKGGELMKAYELLFIVAPTIDDDTRAAVMKRIETTIAAANGTIDNVDPWGKRKLAYEINDLTDGDYTLIDFHADPQSIAELDRVLRITDAVVRHMIVNRPDRDE